MPNQFVVVFLVVVVIVIVIFVVGANKVAADEEEQDEEDGRQEEEERVNGPRADSGQVQDLALEEVDAQVVHEELHLAAAPQRQRAHHARRHQRVGHRHLEVLPRAATANDGSDQTADAIIVVALFIAIVVVVGTALPLDDVAQEAEQTRLPLGCGGRSLVPLELLRLESPELLKRKVHVVIARRPLASATLLAAAQKTRQPSHVGRREVGRAPVDTERAREVPLQLGLRQRHTLAQGSPRFFPDAARHHHCGEGRAEVRKII
jgi:cytochrome b